MWKPKAAVFAVLLACAGLLPAQTVQISTASAWTPPTEVYYATEQGLQDIVIPPPPAPDSDEEKKDFAILKDWQEKRTEKECERAAGEVNSGYPAFYGDIGPFAMPLDKEPEMFLKHVRSDTSRGVYIFKKKYMRPRPYVKDPSITPCIRREDGMAYPSGHTALGRVLALVLSDLEPEKRALYMERSDRIALDRVIGGVHHPSDVETGKIIGDKIYQEIKKNPSYLTDMEKMRKYIKPAK